MPKNSNTLVTIATYNEIENLPRLVDAIWNVLPDTDVLVIDDNSPDGTGDWCDQRIATEPRLRCLHRSGKLGLGSATSAGLKYAVEQGYRYVINMDADFSHHPSYLPALLAGMEGTPAVDVMIGSRYVTGGGIEGWPLKRYFMSRAINVYSRWMLGLKARDCSGAFRCYRTSLLARLDFSAIRSHGYSFQEEVLWCLQGLGARFGETPITFVNRRNGASKIDAREACDALKTILTLGVQNLLGQPSLAMPAALRRAPAADKRSAA